MRGRSFGREFPEPTSRPFHGAWRATVPRSICVASDILTYRTSEMRPYQVRPRWRSNSLQINRFYHQFLRADATRIQYPEFRFASPLGFSPVTPSGVVAENLVVPLNLIEVRSITLNTYPS